MCEAAFARLDALLAPAVNISAPPPPPVAPRGETGVFSTGDDESRLVSAARAGDAAAFETLVRRYERRLFRLAVNITRNHEDAEEVLQDSLLKAYEHLGEFRGESRFYSWLVRIAVNQAIMKLRRRRKNEMSLDDPVESEEELLPRELEDWGPSPEERCSQAELGRILSEAIAELPLAYRTVFQLFDVEEFSLKEVAAMLNLSLSAVKSRLLRARLRLRDKLDRHFRGALTAPR